GVGYFVRSKQPDIFYATTTVLFDPNLATGGQTSNFAQIEALMEVQSGLARRDRILMPVIQELNLPLSVANPNEKMDVAPAKHLPMLEILVGDSNSVTAANIANAIAREMIEQSNSAGI